MSGVVTTVFTTSTQRLTLIPIMLTVVSSLPMLAGFSCASTLKSSRRAVKLAWTILCKIRLFDFRKSKFSLLL